jgi:hypothetical protein
VKGCEQSYDDRYFPNHFVQANVTLCERYATNKVCLPVKCDRRDDSVCARHDVDADANLSTILLAVSGGLLAGIVFWWQVCRTQKRDPRLDEGELYDGIDHVQENGDPSSLPQKDNSKFDDDEFVQTASFLRSPSGYNQYNNGVMMTEYVDSFSDQDPKNGFHGSNAAYTDQNNNLNNKLNLQSNPNPISVNKYSVTPFDDGLTTKLLPNHGGSAAANGMRNKISMERGQLMNRERQCSLEEFALLRVLGQGSYGKVVLVQHKRTHLVYALKVLKKQQVKQQGQTNR